MNLREISHTIPTAIRHVPIEPESLRRARWNQRYRRWRAGILRSEPLCRPCAEAGITVAAEHIDHIEPVHLAPERFWDRTNIQPLCRDCHERKHLAARVAHLPNLKCPLAQIITIPQLV